MGYELLQLGFGGVDLLAHEDELAIAPKVDAASGQALDLGTNLGFGGGAVCRVDGEVDADAVDELMRDLRKRWVGLHLFDAAGESVVERASSRLKPSCSCRRRASRRRLAISTRRSSASALVSCPTADLVVEELLEQPHLAANPSSCQADPGHPRLLPQEANAMSLQYQKRAGARRSGCGRDCPPTPVQGQFIPPWCQQAMVYPEVPVNERASAWFQTETYQSCRHEPPVTNKPHHAQREEVRLHELSDDSCLSRLRSVHAQPEEFGAR